MRRWQQAQILNLLKTIGEAHAQICRLFAANDINVVAQLLTDCQECAIQIGTFIEQIAGEGTHTVGLLEVYCEMLYHASVGLEDTNDINVFIAPLRDHLISIEKCVSTELAPDRLEIVFFPYKAAMWDSMESVWRAASADPCCDVYVVPIPYYDRMHDGRLGRMTYEGDLYPDYVPVTDWREYNVEERYPDAAFIHNPYDDGNKVTSVHPDYYSKRLRDLTDMLCYIPYFVTGSGIADHFCTCAGVVNAHKVFVESEPIRRLYVRAFGAFVKEHGIGKPYADLDKFVASGSPKYDNVVNSKPEDFTLPSEWRRLLERPDGSRRKAVLYNTSLGALLAGGAGYIEKLKAVIAAFAAREDLVLWWRPHPLNDATFKSMLPALRDGYMGVVNAYKRAGTGIFDDTPDLHRALCLTAAYYGDGSSLMPMYQLTGKPLVLQASQMRPGAMGPWHNVAPGCMCECGGYYWFAAYSYNALFRMDKYSREIMYMGSFPGEPALRALLFWGCVAVGTRVYFAPYAAASIAVYDTTNGAFERIELPDITDAPGFGFAYDVAGKFVKVLERDGVLYFIPNTYPGILALDTLDGGITVIDGWVHELGKLANGVDNMYFRYEIFDGGKLLLPCTCANAALEIDLATYGYTLHRFGGSDNKGYTDICVHSGAYWMLSLYGGHIVRWVPGSQITAYKMDVGAEAAKTAWLFQRIVSYGSSLLILPYLAARMARFDVESHRLSVEEGFRPVGIEGDVPDYYIIYPFLYMTMLLDGHVFIQTGLTNVLVEYDSEAGTLREDTLRLSSEDAAALRVRALNWDGVTYETPNDYLIWEQPFAGIEDYFDMLSGETASPFFAASREARAREIARSDGAAGESIYGIVKENVFGHV